MHAARAQQESIVEALTLTPTQITRTKFTTLASRARQESSQIRQLLPHVKIAMLVMLSRVQTREERRRQLQLARHAQLVNF